MEKIRKLLVPILITAIAVFGSVSYLSKGTINIESPTAALSESEVSSSVDEAPLNSSDELSEQSTDEASAEEESLGKVNINTADAEALQIAPGIGPSKAQKIIEYREQYGGFSCVDELIEVSGIGEKTLEKIRDYYTTE